MRFFFTFLNFMHLVLFVAFNIMEIGPLYRAGVMTAFLASFLFLTGFNHFLILYIKRKTILNGWWLLGFLIVVSILGFCDYFNIFSFRHVSELVFTPLLRTPWLVLVPLAMVIAAYLNNYYFLYHNLYLEDIVRKDKRKESSEYAFLNRFGTIGELLALELKLILRNKRPRSIVLLSGVFILYGFVFYKPEYLNKNELGVLLMGGICV